MKFRLFTDPRNCFEDHFYSDDIGVSMFSVVIQEDTWVFVKDTDCDPTVLCQWFSYCPIATHFYENVFCFICTEGMATNHFLASYIITSAFGINQAFLTFSQRLSHAG